MILNKLPTELLLEVVHELDTVSLLQAQETCRRMRQLVAERLWVNLEINTSLEPEASSSPSSPCIKKRVRIADDLWVKDLKRKKFGQQVWIMLTAEEFINGKNSGSLELVLPAVRTMNINMRGKELEFDLCPGDFPRLRLLRVATRKIEAGLPLLDRFSNVEKQLWVEKCVEQRVWRVGQLMHSSSFSWVTCLNLELGDNLEEGWLKMASAMLKEVELLQLSSQHKSRCVGIDAESLQRLLSGASSRLCKLYMTRIEVANPHSIEWMPSQVRQFRVVGHDLGRFQHLLPQQQPDGEPHEAAIAAANANACPAPHITYLNVDLLRGRNSLTSIRYGNLTSLSYKCPYRGQASINEDIWLFRTNPHLKRVIFNCSSVAAVLAMAEYCHEIEVLTLDSRPLTWSREVMVYDLDALKLLAKGCAKTLRRLSIGVVPRRETNAIDALSVFVKQCAQLTQAFLLSTGEFASNWTTPSTASFTNDGFCMQYIQAKSKTRLYSVDIDSFIQECKSD